MKRTRIQHARANEITEELRQAARHEHIDEEIMRQEVASGKVVIVRNTQRNIAPMALGRGTRIKVNANIGSSTESSVAQQELDKLQMVQESGADAVMDLSTGGDTHKLRQMVVEKSSIPVGTVPLYDMGRIAQQQGKEMWRLTPEEMFSVIETHCAQGVDFLTLHCGVNRHTVERFHECERLGGAVSRGGTMLMEWIIKNDKENPLYADYDRVLDICEKYDVAVSLGDGFRPGAIKDATDRVQVDELIVLGELVKRARQRGVGAFVEGPGHVPLNQVAANIQLQKRLCDDAPFYVLGPLVTDVSPGYDHISGAIGGAVAAMNGADFLCYVTPAEHLRLPDVGDVKEGVIASRIAAHAADITRGRKDALEWDNNISQAKFDLDWDKVLSLCIDPKKALQYRRSMPVNNEKLCSMCGEYCAVRRSRNVQNRE